MKMNETHQNKMLKELKVNVQHIKLNQAPFLQARSNNKMENQKKYKIIYADPPWSYRNMGNIQATANTQYPIMKNEDICQLPVNEIADENSILFLWATFPKIQEALDVIRAWGFEYKTVGFVWIKKNKNGSNFFGVGWYTKSNAEVCLIGVKGKAPKISNSISQIIETQREKHSKKPDIVRKKIVEFAGDIPRIELFAREKVDGWDCFGNEVDSDVQLNRKEGELKC